MQYSYWCAPNGSREISNGSHEISNGSYQGELITCIGGGQAEQGHIDTIDYPNGHIDYPDGYPNGHIEMSSVKESAMKVSAVRESDSGNELASTQTKTQAQAQSQSSQSDASTLVPYQGLSSYSGTSGFSRFLPLEMQSDNSNDSVESLPFDQLSRVKVTLCNLRKRYSDGKLAVKKLDMAMVEGQTTCLLGHNGAGKSTTLSVLTGMIPPTSGEVQIYGRNLSTELRSATSTSSVLAQY